VHFVGVTFMPCPERDDVLGECTGHGRIELRQGASVLVSIETRSGDYLLVADGATHPISHPMTFRDAWEASVRADLPPTTTAVVRFGEPTHAVLDEVTGLTRDAFCAGEGDVCIDLIASTGESVRRVFVPRTARPRVDQGATVRRGDLLASFSTWWTNNIAISGIEALRDFLDARLCFGGKARIAPCDATVERVDEDRFVLRTKSDTVLSVRRRPKSSLHHVREGDSVRAGDALDDGPRSHHHLLRVWGVQKLARHMIDELELESARRGLAIPRVHWTLVVRALLAFRRVTAPADTGLRRHRVLSIATFDAIQQATKKRGGCPAVAVPVLRPLGGLAREKRRLSRGSRTIQTRR
jgi:hypothetical protein